MIPTPVSPEDEAAFRTQVRNTREDALKDMRALRDRLDDVLAVPSELRMRVRQEVLDLSVTRAGVTSVINELESQQHAEKKS